jgi:hypothetical protein
MFLRNVGSTQCYSPEDEHWHLHCCDNLEPHTVIANSVLSCDLCSKSTRCNKKSSLISHKFCAQKLRIDSSK